MSVIYLLHFERSYRHARHYLGSTEDLDRRIAEHRAGRGSPLVAAAVAAGIDFQVAATWPGGRSEERRLHRFKNSRARLCPICRAEEAHGPETRQTTPAPAHPDQFIVRALAQLDGPAMPPGVRSALERNGHPRVGSVHGRLELLAGAGLMCKTWLMGEIAWDTVST